MLIGLAGGGLCYIAVGVVKQRYKIDDSLDVFAVHGVGGGTGVLLTAIFVSSALGGAGLPEGRSIIAQFAVQLVGGVATLVWAALASFVIVKGVEAAVGLRVSSENEEKVTVHGERGYNI